MTLLSDTASELIGMFLADARLIAAISALVLIVAGLTRSLRVEPLIAGGTLLIDCLVILVEAAFREARHRIQAPVG